MWVTRSKCPKCFREHMFLFRGESSPKEGELYTGHCPVTFMPFYIPGGREKIHLYKEDKDIELKLKWQRVEKEPEEFVEIRRWQPQKVVVV